jgi:tetrathionate reductase subunit B
MKKKSGESSLSRRTFIATGLAAGACALLPEAAMADSQSPEWGMLVDLNACNGCQACVMACKGVKNFPGQRKTSVLLSEKNSRATFLPVLCNQCEHAACMEACPSQAITRGADGLITVNKEKCIGCGECASACSFQAIFIDPASQKAEKCEFCRDRSNPDGKPPCVESCASNARIFGDLRKPDAAFAQAWSAGKALRAEDSGKARVLYIPLKEKMPITGGGTQNG